MRRLGIIGGMSWVSSAEYYRLLNEGVREALGGTHSAPLVMSSVDFQVYSDLMARGDWDGVRSGLIGEAERIATTGVEAIAIATNTMHMFAADIERASGLPVLHIADAAAAELKAAGHTRVGLLGTRYSMEKDFYRVRLAERHGIECVTPAAPDRERINAIIFDELCVGRFIAGSRAWLLGVVDALASEGIQSVVLGCTELPLVIKQADVRLPVMDTLSAHVHACLAFLFDKDISAV
jgi:aspartate racemase